MRSEEVFEVPPVTNDITEIVPKSEWKAKLIALGVGAMIATVLAAAVGGVAITTIGLQNTFLEARKGRK